MCRRGGLRRRRERGGRRRTSGLSWPVAWGPLGAKIDYTGRRPTPSPGRRSARGIAGRPRALASPGHPIRPKGTDMSFRHLLPLLLVALAAAPHASAQYQWRDANGRMVYSDMPPPASVPPSAVQRAPARQTPAGTSGGSGATASAPAAPAAAPAAAAADAGRAVRKRRMEREAAAPTAAEAES
ncbi:MAG: DUF4124 domain-containing protein, partial [Burkholderiales bacterium]